MTHPLVSVLTPMYNAETYIEGVLSAVAAQTYPEIEHVVIDDGSTDASASVVEAFCQSSSRGNVRLFRQDNAGEASAVNRAFSLSRGKYVVVVNADDPPMKDLISVEVAILESSPETVVVYPDWQLIDADGHCVKTIRTVEYSVDALVGDFYCIPGPGAMIRASALSGSQLRNPSYLFISDLELWLRLGLRGKMQRCPSVLATWRAHALGATAVGRGRLIADELQRLCEEYFSRSDLPDEVRRLERRARAMTLFERGVQKFFDRSIPGRRLIMASFLTLPFRESATIVRRRRLVVIFAVLCVPISNWMLSILRTLRVRGHV